MLQLFTVTVYFSGKFQLIAVEKRKVWAKNVAK